MVANVEPTHSRKRDYTDFPIVLPPPVSPGLKLGFLDIPETTYRSVGGSAKGKIKLTLGPNYFGLRGGMVVVMSLWRGPAGRVEIFGGMELSIYANATFGIEGELLGTDEIIPENLQMKLTPRIPFPQLGYTLGSWLARRALKPEF